MMMMTFLRSKDRSGRYEARSALSPEPPAPCGRDAAADDGGSIDIGSTRAITGSLRPTRKPPGVSEMA